jgi:hypothetical protein
MSSTNNDELKSRFFFPLRTNVDYFRSETHYLDLITRVKQSLLLFDELVFQAGVYWSVVGSKGVVDLIRPFNPMIDKKIKYSDENTAPHFFLRIRPSDASPDTPFTSLLSSDKEVEYQSQFHYLVDEIRSYGIEDAIIGQYDITDPVKKLAKEFTKIDKDILAYDPGNDFLRDKIIENLNKDLLLMSALDLPASIDGLHAPLLAEKTIQNTTISPVPGFYSLDTIVPYVGNLAWEEIADLRQEPSLVEFRKRMVQVEEDVRSAIGEAPEEELREGILSLHQDGLLEEISTLVPQKDKIIKNVVLEIAGNVIPPLGITKSVLEAYDDTKNYFEYKRSWLAMLMRIQEMNK